MQKNKANFILQRVDEDGTAHEPQIHSIQELAGSWNMQRRGFLKTCAVSLTLLSSCDSNDSTRQQEEAARRMEQARKKIAAQEKLSDDAAPQAQPEKDRASGSLQSDAIALEKKCSEIPAHPKLGALAFSGNSRFLISVSRRDKIKIWGIPSGELVGEHKLKKEWQEVVLSPDNMELAAWDKYTIYLLQLPTLEEIREYRVKGKTRIKTVVFANEGETLLIAAGSKLLLYNIYDRAIIKTITPTASVNSLAMSPQGELIAASHSKGIDIIDSKTGSLLMVLPIHSPGSKSHKLKQMIFDPLSVFLAVTLSGKNSLVTIWDLAKRKPLTELWSTVPGRPTIQFINDGRLMIIKHRKSPEFWNVASGTVADQAYTGLKNARHIAFSRNNEYMAAGYGTGAICVSKLPEQEPITCLFDPTALSSRKKAASFKGRNQYGQEVNMTQPCGSPMPAGAICTCNCVPGTLILSTGSTICTCNQVCTCVPVMM